MRGLFFVAALMERDRKTVSAFFWLSPFDVESLKVVSKVLPFELDPLDAGAGRSLAAPCDPLLDPGVRAFGNRFY
jgi:hypothetical protein